ncbi:uncharacterized protein EHS24_005418 [Apiotrichum porosum]|uniref:BRCT domain-containing protein n=1 Tax=Apiotrichum porosum TaxID=105984 RepID=A0A427XCQ1_9TREE|nr:uncharacterized protein EHS24_005418 [Apiotrichum porosum]RSH76671.1 hypothetical protein EHS24_005418 [Apiotrichum porosum]
MPPLTPSSSQEIICLDSPPPSQKRNTNTTPSSNVGPSSASSSSKQQPSSAQPKRRPTVSGSQSRSRVTERMLNSLNNDKNPITHSDAFQRTQHVHSCSTGHQQRGGDRGFWNQARDANVKPIAQEHTYWSVRTANVEANARAKATNVLAGCVIAINGPTGSKVSNLQLQNLITANGGRYVPHQSRRCTHVVAARLSGTKAQKHINGQGSRGAAMRTQVVKVEWVLDCVAQGKRISEAGYGVVEDPSQKNLFTAFGVAPPSAPFTTAEPSKPT